MLNPIRLKQINLLKHDQKINTDIERQLKEEHKILK